jgi:NADPH-dependent glutamate synthase beta subunit-like oxidoreductase
VRSGFEEMKASPWEKEDAMHEGIPIHNFLVPKSAQHQGGKLTAMVFEKVKPEYDAKGRRNLVPTGEPDVVMECDDVLVAVGQENAFPWIERDLDIAFDKWDMHGGADLSGRRRKRGRLFPARQSRAANAG